MTDLIRYPLAVMDCLPWIIVDASGVHILRSIDLTDTGYSRTAEIVRVLNAAWEKSRTEYKPGIRCGENASGVNPPQQQPAPVAPGEPSKEAMKAAVGILKSMGIVSMSKEHSYAEIIDAAFATKLAELERHRQNVTSQMQSDINAIWRAFGFTEPATLEEILARTSVLISAERELDEAKEGLDRQYRQANDHWNARIEIEVERKAESKRREQAEIERDEAKAARDHQQARASRFKERALRSEYRAKELEAERDDLIEGIQSAARNNQFCGGEIEQLRADLDEAVGLLDSAYSPHWRTKRDDFLHRLAAKSQAGDKPEPPETETESGEKKTYNSVLEMVDAISDREFTVELAKAMIEKRDRWLAERESTVAALRQQLADRDATIAKMARCIANHAQRHTMNIPKDWSQKENGIHPDRIRQAACLDILCDPEFYRGKPA